MLKKIFLSAIILLSFPSFCNANACPTFLEIQSGNDNDWELLDINDGSPLSDAKTQKFENNVRAFALAEWVSTDSGGTGHCFYQGDTPNSNYLGAYLSRDNLQPLSPAWQRINENYMRCTAGTSLCLFDSF